MKRFFCSVVAAFSSRADAEKSRALFGVCFPDFDMSVESGAEWFLANGQVTPEEIQKQHFEWN